MIIVLVGVSVTFIRGDRGQNSGGSRLVTGLESTVAARKAAATRISGS